MKYTKESVLALLHLGRCLCSHIGYVVLIIQNAQEMILILHSIFTLEGIVLSTTTLKFMIQIDFGLIMLVFGKVWRMR